jgi:anti-sigma regulatory factor (Ser/Thr protein kinase)
MSEPLSFSFRLPAVPLSVVVARSAMGAIIRGTDPERFEAAELVLSEIVTNAIRHGSRDTRDAVELEVTIDGEEVAGIVRDSGPVFSLPSGVPVADQVGGFGLHIAQVASRLTVERDDRGDIVTFVLPGTTRGTATSSS